MINAGFSEQSIAAVQALLFAESAIQQAAAPQPCPPKKPKEPQQPRQAPAQPPQPQQPRPVTATQQDPTIVKQKKPKCKATEAVKGQQDAVSHSERPVQSIAEKRRKIKALQRAGRPASILIKQVREKG
jgi:hypothetical protein